MMRSVYIIIAVFVLLGSRLSAQSPASDSVRTDTVRNRFIPTGLRIGTDIISIVKDRRQENFAGWEINADTDFNRYLLAVEYGKWARNFPGDSVSYQNDGSYWRTGVDVNFLTRDPERNIFFIGVRYARSKYSESMSLIAGDSIWGFENRGYINNDIRARWFELTTGLKVKIWKFIWFGYTARLKFGLNKDESRQMISYDIPGYGRTDKDTYWGFNYQVMVRIPIRQAPVFDPGKKKK